MTELLLVAHAGIGEAMREVAGVILDRPAPMRVFAVHSADDPDRVTERLAEAVAECARSGLPLVLTDLPGATPHNLALAAVARACPDAPVLTGLNLPMLLRAITHLDRPAGELAGLAADGGRAAVFTGARDET